MLWSRLFSEFVADVLVMRSFRSHRCGLCFGFFSPVPGAGPFLVLHCIIECIIWFRVFFAQHRDSRRFGLVCRCCHILMVASGVHSCGLRSREHDLCCDGLLLGQGQQGLRDHGVVWWCPGWCSVRFGLRRTCSCPDTADVSVDTALVSVDTSLVSEDTALVWLFLARGSSTDAVIEQVC